MAFSRFLLAAALVFASACATQPDASECATGIVCPVNTKCAAVQKVCITNDCGDGIVQATEKCDDGNILDGDGCAANCLSRETCGDGVLNTAAGEICDDGNTTPGDGCAADCRSVEVCGNGIRDVNEVCDDGNTVPGDGCSGNCKSTEVCGNGIVDINEKCDDGATPGGCNADCQGGTGCGDGAIDFDTMGHPLEECDDGNMDIHDDCQPVTCKLSFCGDNIQQTSGSRTEQCDPGAAGETPGCNLDCTNISCGDGKINHAAGEQCDNGPGMNADNRDCTAMCKDNVCGDTHVNSVGPAHIEECDDNNTNQHDGCSNQCTTPHCGNGIVENLEACDDNNTTNGDGCNSLCQYETCGDGVVNNGEACDPSVSPAAPEKANCNADCTMPMCGDKKINHAAGEECDDGNTVDDTDLCRNSCLLNYCGDGKKSPTEACDDGNTNNSDGCSNACTLPSCGDGIKNGTDQCDDGNTFNTDACLNTCLLPTCGDGFTWVGHEQCDNAGTTGNGPDKDCTALCRTNVCGDGFRDQQGASQETCDELQSPPADETACPYGVQSCTMCNSNCTAVENLTGNVCGDGVVSAPEMCDDGNRITETVCPYGTASCASFCKGDCSGLVPTITGTFCGDGTPQPANGEACDDRSPTQSCGLCSNACNEQHPVTQATGLILAPPGGGGMGVNKLHDGDTFTIDDGASSKVFEFDTAADGIVAGNVKIDAPGGDTALQVRDRIISAVNGSGLKIDATAVGTTGAKLTHQASQNAGAGGNAAIVKSLTLTTPDFFATGMSGGWGRDCADDVPCEVDGDCDSNHCASHLCKP